MQALPAPRKQPWTERGVTLQDQHQRASIGETIAVLENVLPSAKPMHQSKMCLDPIAVELIAKRGLDNEPEVPADPPCRYRQRTFQRSAPAWMNVALRLEIQHFLQAVATIFNCLQPALANRRLPQLWWSEVGDPEVGA